MEMNPKKVKLCGLLTRVSSAEQANHPQSSLDNQLSEIRRYINNKNYSNTEEWREVRIYELKGISGKVSIHSRQFDQLREDIKDGIINSVVCTALDRACRSMKDYISLLDYFKEKHVDFVSIKQDFDTSTAHGKLITGVSMQLAEFERDLVVERTKSASLARAENGRWNGSQILGYDLDSNNKGTLVPNEKEKAIVNYAFEAYKQCGSIPKTAKLMNEKGYRTKEYESRRKNYHPPRKFGWTSVKQILTNQAYIGVKEVNKKKGRKASDNSQTREQYHTVDAIWPPIVDVELFNEAQTIIKRNYESKHNVLRTVKHNYVLNGGLLQCGCCEGEMEGGSGTSAKGIRYYYYVCKNPLCKFRISAEECEGIILQRIKHLTVNGDLLSQIVESTNKKLSKDLPMLEAQRNQLQKSLDEINNKCHGKMDGILSCLSDESKKLMIEHLEYLNKQRMEISNGLQDMDRALKDCRRESVNQREVLLALNNFNKTFSYIPPNQQKELLRIFLRKAVLGRGTIKLALFGHLPKEELSSLSKANHHHAVRYQPGSSGRSLKAYFYGIV